ncbi:MAG: LysR family transcriptional regulator [Christensenellales bacterium]|jgi:DNA-binding transcriptional LysR family regulator
MDLKQLRYFVAIAEEGTISAAAKKLHISQPPLSHQLMQLETELGVQLITRGARRSSLTDAGRILYKRARQLISLADAAEREIVDFGNGLQGTLHLGTVSSSGAALLGRRLAAFRAKYPGVQFDIREGNTFELLEMLASEVIEVALVRTPFQSDPFECRFLAPEPMVAVGRAQDMETMPPTIPLEALADKPLIIYRRFEQLFTQCFEQAGIEPCFLCKNDDARTTLLWADAGLGIALVPQSSVQLVPSDRLVRRVIDEARLVTRICAICRKNAYRSPIAQGFLAFFDAP